MDGVARGKCPSCKLAVFRYAWSCQYPTTFFFAAHNILCGDAEPFPRSVCSRQNLHDEAHPQFDACSCYRVLLHLNVVPAHTIMFQDFTIWVRLCFSRCVHLLPEHPRLSSLFKEPKWFPSIIIALHSANLGYLPPAYMQVSTISRPAHQFLHG